MTWSLFFCGFSTNPGLLMDKPDADLRFSTKTGLLMDKLSYRIRRRAPRPYAPSRTVWTVSLSQRAMSGSRSEMP